mgnify:CR=1 FL=1
MPRSTEEQQSVEVKRKRSTGKGLEIDLLVHWNAQQVEVEDEEGQTHLEWEYAEEELTIPYKGAPAEVGSWLENKENEILKQAKSKANALDAADKDDLSYPELDYSKTYKATVIDVNKQASDKRYIKVERTFNGDPVSAWCYVSDAVAQAILADREGVGSIAIVNFVDTENGTEPFVSSIVKT